MTYAEYKEKFKGLYIEIYFDAKHNYSNFKIGHFPFKEYKKSFLNDSYDETLSLYADATGENPQSKENYFLVCQPMKFQDALDWFTDNLNKEQKAKNDGLVQIKQLDYLIYGLQNPHVLPQPEYHI
jgi:hypothetical protein